MSALTTQIKELLLANLEEAFTVEDGKKVKLHPDYADKDPNEVFTVSSNDPERGQCRISDKDGRGWNVRHNQLISAKSPKKSRFNQATRDFNKSRISESSLGDNDRLDVAVAKLHRFDPNHEAPHNKLVGHLLSKGHSFHIAKSAADNRINLRKVFNSFTGEEAVKSRNADWDSSDSRAQRSD